MQFDNWSFSTTQNRLDEAMKLTEFTNTYCMRPQNFAWFLGAGASRSAGLPTATDILWKLKRIYYCREENQDIDNQDIQHESVRTRIQSFMDSKGFPAEWDEEEYSTYFDRVFGKDRENQRKFILETLKESNVGLSVGNRVFGALLSGDFCKIAFTTNFDTVVEKSVANVSGKSLAAFHLERPEAANNALNNEEYPIYCKIHGDFRYESIKNLSTDLANRNEEISNCLVNAGNRFGFIVSGYSGRDESVMELFHEVLDSHNPFPHGLFWTGIKKSRISPNVENLLDKARSKGIIAEYVEIETFDILMLHLWRNIENKPLELDKKVRKSGFANTSISLPEEGKYTPLIRMNALQVRKYSTECLKLTFKNPKQWSDLREAQQKSNGKFMFAKGEEIWCWGLETDIKNAFSSEILSIETVNVSDRFANFSKNLQLQAFFLEGMCRALVYDRPLLSRSKRDSSFIIVNAHANDLSQLDPLKKVAGGFYGEISGLFTPVTPDFPDKEKVYWAEALRVSVEQYQGQIWLLIDPDIWIWPRRATSIAREFIAKRIKYRFNRQYNNLLDGWIETIFNSSMKNIEIDISPMNHGSISENPKFTIGSRTGYSLRLST